MPRRTMILLIIWLSFWMIPAQHVFACTAGPYFSVDELPYAEVIVRATVLETDDVGLNAIIHVEAYYKGQGGQYVAVMRYPAGLQNASQRGYDLGCFNNGRRWEVGTQGYIGLTTNGDGTYTDMIAGEYSYSTAHFFPSNGEIPIYSRFDDTQDDDNRYITEEELVERILEAGNRDEPLAPASNNYPLMRFLNVTAEDGTRYQINPDRSVTTLTDNDPIVISPDGTHVAFRLADGQIAIQYYYTEYIFQDDTQIVSGDHVTFSPDSNFFVAWDEEQLGIYMLTAAGWGYAHNYGYGIDVIQIAMIANETHTLSSVQWSGDSSTIVWEDADGLWYWNIFDEAQATLLSIDEPLLDISLHGHYLRVGYMDNWTLIDTETYQTMDNVLVSSDERFFIDLYATRVMDNCTPPLRETCPQTYMVVEPLRMTYAYRSGTLAWITCATEEADCKIEYGSWQPSYGTMSAHFLGWIPANLVQLSYDTQYDNHAVLTNDNTVYFGLYSSSQIEQYHDNADFVHFEDSVIVTIEWGQPIFYQAQ